MSNLPLKTFSGICGFFVVVVAANWLPLHAQTTNSAAPSAAVPAAGNLLLNGDFSLASSADPTWPDGWAKSKIKGVTWETENGRHFLRLTSQEPDKMLMAYTEVPIPAGTANLQITIRYRTSGVVAGTQNWMDARAIFHFLDDNRKQLSPDPHVLDFSKESGDWTVDTETCAAPAGASKLVVLPCLFRVQTGTLDLSDISVTVVP